MANSLQRAVREAVRRATGNNDGHVSVRGRTLGTMLDGHAIAEDSRNATVDQYFTIGVSAIAGDDPIAPDWLT